MSIIKTKLRKVGSSLGVLIPKAIILEQGLKVGEEVELSLLKKRKIELINEVFGIAKGAPSFKREKERDRI